MEERNKENSMANITSVGSEDWNRVQRVWRIWRSHFLKQKSIKKEKIVYQHKIERFLGNLKKENLLRKKETYQDAKCLYAEDELNVNAEPKENKKWMEKSKCREKEEKIKFIIENLKDSQKETRKKLTNSNAKEKKSKRLSKFKLTSNPFDRLDDSPRNKNLCGVNFLMRSEKRMEERRSRRRAMRERKRKREEEEERVRRKREEERKAVEVERKFQRKEEMREKLIAERERAEEERKAKAALAERWKAAQEHREKVLLRRYGFQPWVLFMKSRRRRCEDAEGFARHRLLRNAFCAWKANAEIRVRNSGRKAEEFYARLLQKQYWRGWLEHQAEQAEKWQAAVDWHELKTTEKAFARWLRFLREARLASFTKMQVAEEYYQKKLKRSWFNTWKNYPERKRQELALERRKRIWRDKVRELVPDFHLSL